MTLPVKPCTEQWKPNVPVDVNIMHFVVAKSTLSFGSLADVFGVTLWFADVVNFTTWPMLIVAGLPA